jgi:1-deoxy-D-xylulose-5-phosphate reductoisomerase
MPAVLNAANEVAATAFLDERIGFLDIPRLTGEVMNRHKTHPVDRIEQVMNADRWSRQTARNILDAGGVIHARPQAGSPGQNPQET